MLYAIELIVHAYIEGEKMVEHSYKRWQHMRDLVYLHLMTVTYYVQYKRNMSHFPGV